MCLFRVLRRASTRDWAVAVISDTAATYNIVEINKRNPPILQYSRKRFRVELDNIIFSFLDRPTDRPTLRNVGTRLLITGRNNPNEKKKHCFKIWLSQCSRNTIDCDYFFAAQTDFLHFSACLRKYIFVASDRSTLDLEKKSNYLHTTDYTDIKSIPREDLIQKRPFLGIP